MVVRIFYTIIESFTVPDGNAYSGKGVRKNGKPKGFLKQTVKSLNRINSTDAGSSMISSLQSTDNNFTIKHSSLNPKGNRSQFFVQQSRSNQAYANQFFIDSGASFAKSALLKEGIDLSGGAGGTICWKPNGTSVRTTAGLQAYATADLAHELFHGLDSNMGMMDNRIHQGLSRNEWSACYGENMVRSQLRKEYRTGKYSSVRIIAPMNTPILQIYPMESRKASSVK